jgi:hypothetical protein
MLREEGPVTRVPVERRTVVIDVDSETVSEIDDGPVCWKLELY